MHLQREWPTGQEMLSRRDLLAVALLSCSGIASTAAQTDPWPTRAVRLVVGYPPGGATDIVARLLATRISGRLNHPLVVENRPGANSNVAAEFVSRAAPDGHTLFFFTVANTINASLYPKLGYDPLGDFEPVGLIATIPNVLVVNAALPATTVAEFIALARASRKPLTFASSGTGSSTHLSGELFQDEAGVTMLHVPYRGSAPAINDLLAGQVDSMFDNAPSALPHIRSGKLRALAVTSPQRLAALPEVPTLSEAGLANFDVQSWFGLAAPAGTPKDVVLRLSTELVAALSSAEVQGQLRSMAAAPRPSSPEQMRQFAGAEVVRWRHVIRSAGISVD